MKLIKLKLSEMILVVLTLFTCYTMAIICDIIIERFEHNMASQNTDAQSILKERRKIDLVLRAKALEGGFQPKISPSVKLSKTSTYKNIWPLGDAPNKKVYYCNEGYGLIKFSYDRYGFRNDDSTWDKNVVNLVIGDSFVDGACVPDQHVWSNNLNNVTLNLGMGGNNPYHYAAILNNFGNCVSPKHVILAFYANDNGYFPEDRTKYKHLGHNSGYFSNIKKCKGFNSDIPRFFTKLTNKSIEMITQNQKAESFIVKLFRNFVEHSTLRKIRGILNWQNSSYASSKLAIKTLSNYCKKKGCKSIVVFIPNSKFWGPDSRTTKYKLFLKDNIPDDMIWLDLTDAVGTLGRSAYAPKGPHLSIEGNKIISQHLNKSMWVIEN